MHWAWYILEVAVSGWIDRGTKLTKEEATLELVTSILNCEEKNVPFGNAQNAFALFSKLEKSQKQIAAYVPDEVIFDVSLAGGLRVVTGDPIHIFSMSHHCHEKHLIATPVATRCNTWYWVVSPCCRGVGWVLLWEASNLMQGCCAMMHIYIYIYKYKYICVFSRKTWWTNFLGPNPDESRLAVLTSCIRSKDLTCNRRRGSLSINWSWKQPDEKWLFIFWFPFNFSCFFRFSCLSSTNSQCWSYNLRMVSPILDLCLLPKTNLREALYFFAALRR